MRVLKLFAFAGLLFVALGFATPQKADAGARVYVGPGGFHLHIGPRYRRHYYRRHYYPSYYGYYRYPRYGYRKRYYRKHRKWRKRRHYRRHYRPRYYGRYYRRHRW